MIQEKPPEPMVSALERLAADDDRGALSALRRSLVEDAVAQAYPYVVLYFPANATSWLERAYLLVAGLFGLVLAFTDMIVIFVLTRGGPYDTTQVLASLAFFTGVQAGDIAEGAAIAVFLFPLLVVVAILFLRVARRSEVV